MIKKLAVVLVCSLALLAGACSPQGPDQKKNAKPAAAHADRNPADQGAAPDAAAAPQEEASPEGMAPDEDLGEEWAEPKELGPAGHAMDALAQSVCQAGFTADPDGIFNALHPRVRTYLEEGNAAGMDDISIDALKDEMRQSMQEDPLQKCEPAAAVLLECEQHIVDMYKEIGLPLEACGKVTIKITLKQAGEQDEQVYTAKVDGKWYLNDM